MQHKLFHGDCLEKLAALNCAECLFADPVDNIGLGYNECHDKKPDWQYASWLRDCVSMFMTKAPIVWISFNAKWTFAMGDIFQEIIEDYRDWEAKPCVQTFTFGQHRKTDLGNCHRPLWRLRHKDAPLYPHAIRIESERQRIGDKRANPGGRVPGDVFEFPRVTGNSRQRRSWHPTQLHEGMIERIVLFSTLPGDRVIDPFGGTGTTLRVCKRLERRSATIEMDGDYCSRIAEENGLRKISSGIWGI